MEEKPVRLCRIAIMQPMSSHHEQAPPADRGQSVTRRWRRNGASTDVASSTERRTVTRC